MDDIVTAKNNIRLRPARLEDVPLLESWDRDPGVKANTGTDGDMEWRQDIARKSDWQEILIAEQDGRPIGVVVIIDAAREESHYWGDVPDGLRAIDIWIGSAADRGCGHGSATMRQAIARCFQAPDVTAILIDPLISNTRAQAFYRRHGFYEIGPRRFGDDDCLVMRLDREDWGGN